MNVAPETVPQTCKTFICFGVARGGTSAVAGVLQRLGVYMGDNLPNNYEDPQFINKPREHMLEVIAQRDAQHEVWGWKFPNAANYLDALLPSVQNPHLILVFRDLVATVKAHMRWHNRDQLFAMHDVLIQQQRNWFLTERWKLPTALVSYEKAILAPNLFIHEMADFVGLPKPDEEVQSQMVEFLEPGSYK